MISSIIQSIPKYISFQFYVSFMNAGVVTILLFLSTWIYPHSVSFINDPKLSATSIESL